MFHTVFRKTMEIRGEKFNVDIHQLTIQLFNVFVFQNLWELITITNYDQKHMGSSRKASL